MLGDHDSTCRCLSLDKQPTFRAQKPRVCDLCEKPLPDEATFRRIVINCYKKGFYVLETTSRTREVPYCLCKCRIQSRLASTHQSRSRVKRKMAFIAQFRHYERQAKRSFLGRGNKPRGKSTLKALQRYLKNEDLVLWDWELFDESGKAHFLEKVLDSALLRSLISKPGRTERLSHLERILNQLAYDPSLVTLATAEPPEPLEEMETNPDVEELWRRRLDDEE
jgi:hypothetical protein